ncbi:MAG: lipoxygenase [Oscillatoria sp. SIO1A7]|nr:lipoxygenase [Oscillatoria sp. SIO1A7]
MTFKAKTASALDEARKEYQYNYTHIEPIAMVNELPLGEYPSLRWVILNLKEAIKLAVNSLKNDEQEIVTFFKGIEEVVKEDLKKLGNNINDGQIFELLNFLKSAGLELLEEKLPKDLNQIQLMLLVYQKIAGGTNKIGIAQEETSDQTSNLDKYNNLFVTIDLPAIADNFQEDETFAYMRVAGPNPLTIERMTEPNSKFPVTEEQYKSVMGDDDSLEVALGEGRVYIADYAILDGAIDGTFPEYQKYLYAPLAMFAVPKGTDNNRMLKPVAIQCQQEPGPDNPILTPKSNPNSWMFAKTVVQIADGNFHEAVSHLARTHLFIEPFVIATHRQLSDTHPLSVLLRPHFEGTLFINNGAQKSLIAKEGGVNGLLAASIDSSRIFTVTGLKTYPFNEQMLRAQLERRGVLDTSKLPVYPYRDDALLLWDAIYEWVSGYLKIYYKSDLDVQGDTELQAWGADVIGFKGGRANGFGYEGTGSITTLSYLIEATTLIIFTASAQHAAVNFPQKDIMSYAPAMPLAGYAAASSVKEASEQDFLKLLPPLPQARGQLNLGCLLGSVYYTQLGKYKDDDFEKEDVKQLLNQFKAKLDEIQDKINQRNQEASYLPYAYEYLLPTNIPQSINV